MQAAHVVQFAVVAFEHYGVDAACRVSYILVLLHHISDDFGRDDADTEGVRQHQRRLYVSEIVYLYKAHALSLTVEDDARRHQLVTIGVPLMRLQGGHSGLYVSICQSAVADGDSFDISHLCVTLYLL